MKKNWLIRAFLALLCMALFCSVPAYAIEVRASERINLASARLSKKDDGNLSIYFSVQASGRMDVIGASSVKIQRNTFTGWVTEYTFTPSNTPAIQMENKFQHSTTLTYSPLFAGKEYRAVVMIYVEDAAGSSTQQLTSRTVTT